LAKVYLLVFKDDGGHVFSAATLSAEHDAGAIAKARSVYRSGIGRGFEIRDGERLVHAELNYTAAPLNSRTVHPELAKNVQEWANEHLARAVECQRLAGETRDPVLREQLLGIRQKCLDAAASFGRTEFGGAGAPYQLHLYEADGRIMARELFDAPDDGEALQIAAALFDACSELCADYRLTRDGIALDPVEHLSRAPSASLLRARAQQIVLEREIALADSHELLAGSKRLLDKAEEWSAAILV